MFTRTRYQYGSLETKKRKKGKEVWEFRYYETDGRGERQRRATMGGHWKSTRPNLPQGRLLRYRRSCCGSMQNSRQRRPARRSLEP